MTTPPHAPQHPYYPPLRESRYGTSTPDWRHDTHRMALPTTGATRSKQLLHPMIRITLCISRFRSRRDSAAEAITWPHRNDRRSRRRGRGGRRDRRGCRSGSVRPLSRRADRCGRGASCQAGGKPSRRLGGAGCRQGDAQCGQVADRLGPSEWRGLRHRAHLGWADPDQQSRCRRRRRRRRHIGFRERWRHSNHRDLL